MTALELALLVWLAIAVTSITLCLIEQCFDPRAAVDYYPPDDEDLVRIFGAQLANDDAIFAEVETWRAER